MREYKVSAQPAGQLTDTAGLAELTPNIRDTYESRLKNDRRWALMEGSQHFDESSAVFATLHRIAHKLDELRIPDPVIAAKYDMVEEAEYWPDDETVDAD